MAGIGPADVDIGTRADIGAREFLARAEIAEPLFEVEQTINAPIPLAPVIEHRARIMPQISQPRAALVQRCCGRGDIPAVGQVGRPLQAVMRRDQIRVAGRPGSQLRQLGLVLTAAGADVVDDELDVIAIPENSQHLLGQV